MCNQEIKNISQATLEHIIPRSKGGNNKKDNLALFHSFCNQIKSNELDHSVWREKINYLVLQREFILWQKDRSDHERKDHPL